MIKPHYEFQTLKSTGGQGYTLMLERASAEGWDIMSSGYGIEAHTRTVSKQEIIAVWWAVMRREKKPDA